VSTRRRRTVEREVVHNNLHKLEEEEKERSEAYGATGPFHVVSLLAEAKSRVTSSGQAHVHGGFQTSW
jgi:hypothetical protein